MRAVGFLCLLLHVVSQFDPVSLALHVILQISYKKTIYICIEIPIVKQCIPKIVTTTFQLEKLLVRFSIVNPVVSAVH